MMEFFLRAPIFAKQESPTLALPLTTTYLCFVVVLFSLPPFLPSSLPPSFILPSLLPSFSPSLPS